MNEQVVTPSLLVPRHVLTKIADESSRHPQTETGASLIGVEVSGQIVILEIIPDEINIERSPGLFQNGSEYQVELYRWYKKHWNMMRANSRKLETQICWKPSVELPDGYVPPELDVDLKYLGDWHKHPGTMTHLSGRDLRTIQDILTDKSQKREQLLSPIVTKISSERNKPLREYEMTIDSFRMSWYYSSRSLPKTVGIKPFPIKSINIPRLPPVPWHLGQLQRFDEEMMYLGLRGYRAQWKLRDIDNDSICEIVFSIDSPWSDYKYIVVTKWNYPLTFPQIYQYGSDDGKSGKNLDVSQTNENVYLVDILLQEEGVLHEQSVDESRIPDGKRIFSFGKFKNWSGWSWFSRKPNNSPTRDVGSL